MAIHHLIDSGEPVVNGASVILPPEKSTQGVNFIYKRDGVSEVDDPSDTATFENIDLRYKTGPSGTWNNQ